MAIPGYVVVFPKFDLAGDFNASYELVNLPVIDDKEVGVSLLVDELQGGWNEDVSSN